MKDFGGFTLIELMVTISIVAILASIAAPSFTDAIKANRLTAVTNELIADLALARSEAAKRGRSVSICASSNGSSCTGGSWIGGRIVFSDTGSVGTVDGTDTIVRVTEGNTSNLTLSSNAFANAGHLQYGPTGGVSTGSTNQGTFKLCDDRVGNFGKLITITNTGRPSVTSSVACP